MDAEKQIKFQFFHEEEPSTRFEQSLTLFFGLRGTVSVFSGNREHRIGAGGLLAVNTFMFYQVFCWKGSSAIALLIPQELLRLAGWEDGLLCQCHVERAGDDGCNELRRLYAELFRDFFEDAEGRTAQISSGAIQLAGQLRNRFSVKAEHLSAGQRTSLRLKRVLDVIHSRWNEELVLSEIAKQEFLSVGYLSRLFKQSLHTTFTQYLTDLRLGQAARMLAEQGDSITKIAYSCGFRDGSAFARIFRERYGQTPGQYRAAHQRTRKLPQSENLQSNAQESLSVLLAYAQPKNRPPALPMETKRISVVCGAADTPLRNTWRRLCNIGYAQNGLLAEVRQQLEQAQHEIGFEYLRFHGLFDEDMKLYMERPDGSAHYNFTYTDLLFDYISRLGMKAYVELSFLPPPLAAEQTRIFDRASVIAACKNLEKWTALVRAVLLHFVDRYGRETVRGWRFTTVSMNYAFLGCMTIEEYFALYQASYQAVKSVDATFSFGGPGGFANLVWEAEGYRQFLSFAAEQNCMPDFFAVQCYPHRAAGLDPEFMDFTSSQQSVPTVLSSDENFMRHVRGQMETLFTEYSVQDRELWFEECNSTLWQRDLSSDTCYKAVWLAKNLCENYDQAEAFGYWLLTDLIDEHANLDGVFHGGYGLFTYNGVPKSGYQALRFLRRLGDTLVGSGDGWFLTRRAGDYQLLLYNYCHYDKLYCYRYQRLEKPQDAYSVFQDGPTQKMELNLEGLPAGTYRLESWSIRRGYGSSFDRWLETGAPEYLRPEELRYLAETSQPSYHVREILAKGPLRLDETLQPLETRLLLLYHLDDRSV